MSVDLEREGLLAGCSTDAACAARSELVEELLADDVPLEAIRQAVAEHRLALLPAERALTGGELYTVREVAERTGVDVDQILRQRQGLGLPRPELDDRLLTDDDVAAAERLRRFGDAGLSEEAMMEVSRAVGQAMENVSAVSRQVTAEALLEPGDTELDLARRYAAAASELAPLMGALLDYQYRIRLREGIRRDAISPEALASGELPDAAPVAVGFADLVGFTRLGERLPAADLGRLAGRLAELADEVAESPVRIVKTIGDAVMLSAPDPLRLVEALLGLVEAAEAAGDEFPQLRAGAAFGPALARGGDWYGRPVNLASRVTDVARPGSVLVAEELHDALEDSGAGNGGNSGAGGGGGGGDGPLRFSRIPRRRLKGVQGHVTLYRVRRRGEDDRRE